MSRPSGPAGPSSPSGKPNGSPQHRDPAQIEREVIVLRDDCARLLHELEHRYQRVSRVPRRIKERGLRAEHAVAGFVTEHKVGVVAAGLAVVGATALLLYAYGVHARRPRVRARALARRVRRRAIRLQRRALG